MFMVHGVLRDTESHESKEPDVAKPATVENKTSYRQNYPATAHTIQYTHWATRPQAIVQEVWDSRLLGLLEMFRVLGMKFGVGSKASASVRRPKTSEHSEGHV